MALWSNTYHQAMAESAYQLNQSLAIDLRLLPADLEASQAHAKMLGQQGIIAKEEAEALVASLGDMQKEYAQGKLTIDPASEDIHSFIESELTKRLGDIGKKVHTGRSRNDQVATAMKIYARTAADELLDQLDQVVEAFCQEAGQHLETIMPGYTHLQRAQAVTYGHYLMAYVEMFMRDYERLMDAQKRINHSMPLGAGALATTTFPLDRQLTTELLAFDAYAGNSIDAVSDRDYSIELLSALALISMHLSRYSEEMILWASQEFQLIVVDDRFSTGSSIMPQKKNLDIHELMRGKAGRVYGDLMAVLTIMKGIPLAYDKDLQEEKERLFDAIDTVQALLNLLPAILDATHPQVENMYQAAGKGYLNATDCADYLSAKGLPFRDAYRQVGDILKYCHETDKTLEELSLEEYQSFNDLFEADIYQAIDLKHGVYARQVAGGPAPDQVKEHIAQVKERLKNYQNKRKEGKNEKCHWWRNWVIAF